MTRRVAAGIEAFAETAGLGDIEFKGLARPVTVFNVAVLRN